MGALSHDLEGHCTPLLLGRLSVHWKLTPILGDNSETTTSTYSLDLPVKSGWQFKCQSADCEEQKWGKKKMHIHPGSCTYETKKHGSA